MQSIAFNSGIIAIIYVLIKFAEMRLIQKESKPIKEVVKDGLIVYISAFIGFYIISEFVDKNVIKSETTKAFLDAPGF